MIVTVRRLDMKLKDEQFLQVLMTHRGYTVRSLADAVERQLRKKDRKARVSHSTIGHLRSGERKTAKPAVAAAIEDILNEPRGSLFSAEVSIVQRETSRKKVAA